MKRIIGNISVRARGDAYVASYLHYTASATQGPALAVRRCAAKAFRLCPAKCPDGVRPGAYVRSVDLAANKVAVESNLNGTYTATVDDGGAS